MRTETSPKNAMPHERDTVGVGIPAKVVAQSIELLNRTLSNAFILLIKTKKCHWDVAGPQFMTLHKMLDDHYTLLDGYSDEAAERIRMLGGFPVGTATGFLALTDLDEQPVNVPTATEIVVLLLRDHETVARTLREAVRELKDEDVGTADFLTGMLRGHEKMAWMLRSFLQGDAVHRVSTLTMAPRMPKPVV